MHEASLVAALFDQIERAIAPHPARSVREVHVRVGRLAGVEPQLFSTAFEGLRDERGYAAATLRLVLEDALWACELCGAALAPGERLQCACGGAGELRSGGDVFLDRLELEVPDV